MMQPLLIERILDALDFNKVTVNSKPTPSTYILHKDENREARKDRQNYRSLIGILNYLTNTARLDISMALHQCTRFSNDPKLTYEKAVKRIVKYLKGTKDIGIKVRVNAILGFNACVDTDFASRWNKLEPDDISTLFSRTGFITYFFRFLLTWHSKL